MKPTLGLAVNKLGNGFIIALFPIVTQTPNHTPFLDKNDISHLHNHPHP